MDRFAVIVMKPASSSPRVREDQRSGNYTVLSRDRPMLHGDARCRYASHMVQPFTPAKLFAKRLHVELSKRVASSEQLTNLARRLVQLCQ